MTPRIFISSTFYDLKYIRDDISNFIRSYGFEAVMFEDGDIGYTPGQPLDASCYEAMKNSDMAILIIGGNYGSESSIKTDTSTDTSDFSEFISVTRQEFKTAHSEGIPIYVFIEEYVYAEYEVFVLNKDVITKDNFTFKATKNINVFSFIQEISSIGNISITEFKRPSDIKSFLEKQWSDMFKVYLKSLRESQHHQKTNDLIIELRSAISEMQVFINALVEKTFNAKYNLKYDSIKQEQRNIKAKELTRKIRNDIDFKIPLDKYESKDDLHNLIEEFLKELISCSEETVRTSNLGEENDQTELYKNMFDRVIKKMDELGIEFFMLKSGIFSGYISEMSNDLELQSDVIEILVNQIYSK